MYLAACSRFGLHLEDFNDTAVAVSYLTDYMY